MPGPMERIKARWAAEGIAIRPGASPEALAAFESKYRIALPSTVRDYFAAVDGSGDHMDGECFRFWPLAEVMPIAEYHGWELGEDDRPRGWFLFADFLINSHSFAVRLTPDPDDGGPVAFADGLDLFPLAPSFADFLDRYLADRDNLRYYLPSVED